MAYEVVGRVDSWKDVALQLEGIVETLGMHLYFVGGLSGFWTTNFNGASGSEKPGNTDTII